MANDSELIARAQQAYRRATSLGQVLETSDSFRPAAIDFEAAANAHVPDSLITVTRDLFHARADGSRFLSPSEWAALDRAAVSWPDFAPLTQCRLLNEPWRGGIPSQHGRLVVLDARTLQLPHMNGTKNHALALARAFAAALPARHELALFTSPQLPPVAPEISALATIPWAPRLIGEVDLFVQLATVVDPADPTNVDLLRAPWIRRISVFLDDIQGCSPAHFIGSHAHFWDHQVAIEKLRTSDAVLTLSHTSNEEARRLWNSLDRGNEQPEFFITSCQSGLSTPSAESVASRSNEFLVFGNHLPHKNVALAAAAAAAMHSQTAGNPKITFVAGVNALQEDSIRNLARDVASDAAPAGPAGESSPLSFARNLTEHALSARIAQSRGIIIPSLHEGFSLPVIEALERNVPVTLSRIPAHQELLPEGPWFFDPRDVGDLVRAGREMGDLGENWVAEQRSALRERYSPDRLTEVVASCMHRLLTTPPMRRAQPARLPARRPVESSMQAAPVTVAQLRMRDTQVITTLLARPQSADAMSASQRTLTSVRHEHDAVVAEFLRSRTWRVGRAVLAPARLLRRVLGRR